MLQLLELGPKIEFWQGRAMLWAPPGPTSLLLAEAWSRAGVKAITDPLCPPLSAPWDTGLSAPAVP